MTDRQVYAPLGGVVLRAQGFGPRGEEVTPVTPETPLPVAAAPASDQDPILDHENGAKVTAGTNWTTVLTPPAGCKYIRISAEGDVFVRTDAPASGAGVDDGKAARLIANTPEILPVTAGVAVRAFAATNTVVRAVPYKAR